MKDFDGGSEDRKPQDKLTDNGNDDPVPSCLNISACETIGLIFK